MTADTPARCEPPPELAGMDGWHWVEAPAIKQLFIRRWWRARGDWCWADMDERTLRSFRYLTPVTPLAEVDALRAEVMRASTECADAMAYVVALRARVARLEEALRDMVQEWGNWDCPVCGGDCSAANPPIGMCPMIAQRNARNALTPA